MASDDEEVSDNSRYSQWFATLAFSAISLASLTTGWVGGLSDQDGENVWVFSAIIVVMIVSALAVLAHMVQQEFSGTPVEAGMAVIVLALITAALPAIMKPGNGMAVLGNGGISNANLFFSSWGTFCMAFSILTHYAQNVLNVKTAKNPKFKRGLWLAMLATSIVVLASSTAIWRYLACEKRTSSRCNRLVFAICLGTITAFISMVWLWFGARCHGILDWILGMLMLASWSFGVGFLTFGVSAPANFIGNLYFSTWAGFVISCRLASKGIRDIINSASGRSGGGGGDHGGEAMAAAAAAGESNENEKDDNAEKKDEEDVHVSATDTPASAPAVADSAAPAPAPSGDSGGGGGGEGGDSGGGGEKSGE